MCLQVVVMDVVRTLQSMLCEDRFFVRGRRKNGEDTTTMAVII
jgi:hypothetical protein